MLIFSLHFLIKPHPPFNRYEAVYVLTPSSSVFFRAFLIYFKIISTFSLYSFSMTVGLSCFLCCVIGLSILQRILLGVLSIINNIFCSPFSEAMMQVATTHSGFFLSAYDITSSSSHAALYPTLLWQPYYRAISLPNKNKKSQ